MPQVQYPFIDIAVHPAVRAKFAAGEAIAIFSREMTQVLWANGEGAKLFGHASIYDFLDNGPDRTGVAFRQLTATARQLQTVGDRRSLMMRVSTGFVSQAVAAEVTLVEIRRDETVVIFSAPVAANATQKARIASMLRGFGDPDTHMAVIDDHGVVLGASPGFDALGILPQTARTLIAAVDRTNEGLIKRPIASGAGYLPAAIGRLSVDPPLNLLFCVETVLGRMDAPHDALEPASPAAAVAETPAEPPVQDAVDGDVSLPGLNEPMPDLAEGTSAPAGMDEPEAAQSVQEGDSPAAAAAPFMDIAERVWQPQAVADTVATASEPSHLAAVDAPAGYEAEASRQAVEPHAAGEAPQGLEPAADQAEAAAKPGLAEPQEPFEAVNDMAASGDQPADEGRSQSHGPAEQPAAENLEFAADQAEAAASPDDVESQGATEPPSEAMHEAAISSDQPADDDRSGDAGADEQPAAENLELAADQAESASMAESAADAEPVSENLPHNLELASDAAEAQLHAFPDGSSEPEELVEAGSAEAALNEGDYAEDIEGLAALDGTSTADFDTQAAPDSPELTATAADTADQTVAAAAEEQALAEASAQPVIGQSDAGSQHNPADIASEAEAERTTDTHVTAAAMSPLADVGEPSLPVDTGSEPAVQAATETSAGTAIGAAPQDAGEPSADNAAEMTPRDRRESLAGEMPVAAEAMPASPVHATADASADIATDTPSESAPAADDAAAETATEAQADVAADETPAAAEADAQPAFQFRRDGRPVRFVWKLDAQGRFSEVSDEFARTVGPHAGNINGMSYRDLDSLFNLDPDKEIGILLERRDTWSGRTIRWPVEGTDLVVPVDLAALPTYSRNREFDGFRGFGIIRVADAEQDPNAVGLTLGRPGTGEEQAQPMDAEPAADEDRSQPAAEQATDADPLGAQAGEDVPLTVDGQFEDLHADEPVATFSEPQTILTSDLPSEPEDEFRGEVPALKLESNPLAGFSQKVVQLEERRARGRDGLTPNEQNAFREIARQLEPFGKRPNEVLLNQQNDAGQETQTPAPAEDRTAQTASDEGEDAAPPALAVENIAEEAPQAAEDAELASRHEDAIVDATAEAPTETSPAEHEAGDTEEVLDEIGLTASAADQIPLPILIHAGDRLIHANSEFKRFSGYESLEALEAAGGLDALIARREGPDAGVYAIRADGTELPVSARLQSVRYEGAKLLMLTMVQAEAAASTEDNLAEDHESARKLSALKVEVDELHSILETATDGVVVLDTDGRIRSMNRSASALFNFEDSETRGKPFAMLFAHESQKAVQDYLNGLIGHGVASVLNDGREVIGREASGGFIPLFMTMGRMPGSNSYCAVIRDITQWKRSEEELRAAKRAAETANQHKSDFLARVSHEIRTPLNAIIGFSDMIASEHFGPAGHPRYVEYANDIGRSGRHVLDIVNDLLDISKIEAGEMDLEFAAVGINDCVSEAVSLVQPQANTQRVIIRTSLSQSVPDVVADVRSIKQIAINILANAIRFTPSGGQIVVSTAYEPTGSVALRIRDTGVGMSKGELEQAMKPFGQVSPGARKRGDGTGLGLPLTKAMTEANRALFSIQSSPNEGTLVEIVFPPQRVLAD